MFLGVFNQLLKFYTIKNIDSKYDWVLYLDCDAGLTGNWDNNEITSTINNWESLGYDMMATRTNAIVGQELKKHGFGAAEAISAAIKETGLSMVYTSVILFSGFCIFSASSFGGTVALGVLVSLTLLISMFTNIILLPAILLSIHKKSMKKEKGMTNI